MHSIIWIQLVSLEASYEKWVWIAISERYQSHFKSIRWLKKSNETLVIQERIKIFFAVLNSVIYVYKLQLFIY